MATWPLADASLVDTLATNAAASTGVAVVASATPHTKGAWTELVASTARDYDRLDLINATGIAVSGATSSTLIDLGIGGPGSEQTLVSDISMGNLLAGSAWHLPVRVAAGHRLSARLQSVVASKSVSLSLLGYAAANNAPDADGLAVTYGTVSASSEGTALAEPGGANTKGAWTQIAAATTRPARWVLICVGNAASSAMQNSENLIDIAYGGAGSEQMLFTNLPGRTDSIEQIGRSPLLLPCRLPSGERLAARYQSTSTSGTTVPRVQLITFG